MSSSKIFLCNERQRNAIYLSYGRTSDLFQRDVDSIREYFRKQRHLPEVPSDRLISLFLILNKCTIEKTKKKIDMYYTMRGLLPDLYNIPPDDPRIIKAGRVTTYLPLPHLTEDNSRITICRMMSSDPNDFDMGMLIRYILHVLEVRILEDLAHSEVVIVDLTEARLGHLAKMTPILVKKLNTIVDKVYSSRYQAMYFVHPGNVIDGLVSMVKMILPEKLAKRVHSHKTVDAFKDTLPLELLPKDYGGHLKTIKELNEDLLKQLDYHKEHIKSKMKLRTDESLREGEPINDDILGIHGNFRKLDVD